MGSLEWSLGQIGVRCTLVMLAGAKSSSDSGEICPSPFRALGRESGDNPDEGKWKTQTPLEWQGRHTSPSPGVPLSLSFARFWAASPLTAPTCYPGLVLIKLPKLQTLTGRRRIKKSSMISLESGMKDKP